MRRAAAALAIALGTALAVYPYLAHPQARRVTALALAGLACMTAALTRRRLRGLTVLAAVLFGFHYTATLHAAHVRLDPVAPLYAVGLFAFVEMMDLAVSLADVAPAPGDVILRRVTSGLLIAGAGGLLALGTLVARSLLTGASITLLLVGAVSALGAIALPLWLAQPAGEPRAPSAR